MYTDRTIKFASKVRDAIDKPVCIKQEIWIYDPEHKTSRYNLTYFLPHEGCEIVSFSSWKELVTFCKEKWNV